jgi:hypothetical protein
MVRDEGVDGARSEKFPAPDHKVFAFFSRFITGEVFGELRAGGVPLWNARLATTRR